MKVRRCANDTQCCSNSHPAGVRVVPADTNSVVSALDSRHPAGAFRPDCLVGGVRGVSHSVLALAACSLGPALQSAGDQRAGMRGGEEDFGSNSVEAPMKKERQIILSMV